ncbi:aminotransferase class III-fold pyridoxal phosphate-dependent enzyme [Myxococcota bacterium]
MDNMIKYAGWPGGHNITNQITEAPSIKTAEEQAPPTGTELTALGPFKIIPPYAAPADQVAFSAYLRSLQTNQDPAALKNQMPVAASQTEAASVLFDGDPPKTPLEKLRYIESFGGSQRERETQGLSEDVVKRFLQIDESLEAAIDQAFNRHCKLVMAGHGYKLEMDERELRIGLQEHILNFYGKDAVNPFVSLGGVGPWLVTAHGAVVHDCAGYGMLGLGHSPQPVLDALSEPGPMANAMQAFMSARLPADSLSVMQPFIDEMGRKGGCPYTKFLCMNSGSESFEVAALIANTRAKSKNKPTVRIALKGGFHGRTGRAASYSDSSRPVYEKNLASGEEMAKTLITVEPNSLEDLERAFKEAEARGCAIEAFAMEPVMGEGNPGVAIKPDFYQRARDLTRKHHCMLIVDSIQAAFRAHGCMSIVDYPDFEHCDPPDMETASKAVNAGQSPFSLLALSGEAADWYARGTYGNTMTGNRKALEVAYAVLGEVNDEMRENIVERGIELKAKLGELAKQLPGVITNVEGTGLLVSAALDPSFEVVGEEGVERKLRTMGLGIIHGGTNALRLTPHFGMTSAEVDLVVATIRRGLQEYQEAQAAT